MIIFSGRTLRGGGIIVVHVYTAVKEEGGARNRNALRHTAKDKERPPNAGGISTTL